MVETEYTVPGHPPTRDIDLNIDSLKQKAGQWAKENGGELPKPEDLQRPRYPRPEGHHGHKH